MNLAAIDWLSISINLLLVIFVIVCLLMILLILMQRPKQEGLGAAFGAGVTDQVFGARTTNVLQRGTVYLASLFFLLALTLAVLIGHKNKKIDLKPSTPAAKVETTEPAKPDAESVKPKSLSEELPGDDSTPAETPVKPETQTPPTAPVDPIPAPVDPIPAPVDPIPAPVDPNPAPVDPPNPAPADKADISEEKSAQP